MGGNSEQACEVRPMSKMDEELQSLHASMMQYGEQVQRLDRLKQKYTGPVPRSPDDGNKQVEPHSTLDLIARLNEGFIKLNNEFGSIVSDLQEII